MYSLYFNYHTHTKLCDHASTFDVIEYVDAARANGIRSLGFTCHVPFTPLEYQEVGTRMHFEEVDKYIQMINDVKRKYLDMNILIGFECEFDQERIKFLNELRNKVDFLVLGQHYVQGFSPIDNPNYPIHYADTVAKAIRSGLFDIVVHPDYYLRFKKTIKPEEEDIYNYNAKNANAAIIEAAKQMNIPLEINLNGYKSQLGYPQKEFWDDVYEAGATVIIGVDAHNPDRFNSMKEDTETVLRLLGNKDYNFVHLDYNPVFARKRDINKTLDISLNNVVKDHYEFETEHYSKILENTLSYVDKNASFERKHFEVMQRLTDEMNSLTSESLMRAKDLIKRKEDLARNQRLDIRTRDYYINRTDEAYSRINNTFFNKTIAYNRLIDKTEQAFKDRITIEKDLVKYVKYLIEIDITKDDVRRNYLRAEVQKIKDNYDITIYELDANDNIINLEKNNNEMEEQGAQLEQAQVLTKRKNGIRFVENGFVKVIGIVFILTLVSGIGIGIGLTILNMLYK